MENRLDILKQYKSEIFELKKKLAEKEAEYLDVGKEIFEQDTAQEVNGKTVWKPVKTVLKGSKNAE